MLSDLNASNCGLGQSATRSEKTEGPYELYEQGLRVGAAFAETTQLEVGRRTITWPVDIGTFKQREEAVSN